MAPAAQRDLVETSLASNPRFVPQKIMAVLRVFEIMVVFFSPPCRSHDAGPWVERRAPWGLRWGTLQIRATLGHKQGLMEALCPICFPRTVLLGCERQHDKVGGFKVAFCGLGCKDAVAAPEDSIF